MNFLPTISQAPRAPARVGTSGPLAWLRARESKPQIPDRAGRFYLFPEKLETSIPLMQ